MPITHTDCTEASVLSSECVACRKKTMNQSLNLNGNASTMHHENRKW